ALTASSGGYPMTIRSLRSSEQQYGNPWQGPAEERNTWAKGLGVPVFDGSQDWLLYICCTSCYDVAARGPARSLARLLLKAGVSFGVAPTEAVCCGDTVRETGDADLTESLGRRNISLFQKLGANKVIASSPHCFNAFQKDYPAWGASIEASHYSMLFDDLLSSDRLRPTRSVRRKITYHDPCYLGRHNGIYEPPRRILARLPDAQVVEMARNRELSLCCGGGGGGMFMERAKGERFANLRIQEALDTGADTLATACAYCHAMFRDAVRVMGVEDRLAVLDLAELLEEAIEETE
ncbi:(Fe-S)-binding protein, partial [Candidatus Bipolaricaulota bacterium]|nr:(Fe-S)-binding protein [Candidatus Bipolaricaulota bacterium]